MHKDIMPSMAIFCSTFPPPPSLSRFAIDSCYTLGFVMMERTLRTMSFYPFDLFGAVSLRNTLPAGVSLFYIQASLRIPRCHMSPTTPLPKREWQTISQGKETRHLACARTLYPKMRQVSLWTLQTQSSAHHKFSQGTFSQGGHIPLPCVERCQMFEFLGKKKIV